MGSVIVLTVLVVSSVYAQEKAENLTITAPGFQVNFRVLHTDTKPPKKLNHGNIVWIFFFLNTGLTTKGETEKTTQNSKIWRFEAWFLVCAFDWVF